MGARGDIAGPCRRGRSAMHYSRARRYLRGCDEARFLLAMIICRVTLPP